MATVNIVLVILIIRCAIVMSEYETNERSDETSSSSAEQQMALVVENQRQLLRKMDEHDQYVKLLQEDVKGFQADVKGLEAKFNCHISLCISCSGT